MRKQMQAAVFFLVLAAMSLVAAVAPCRVGWAAADITPEGRVAMRGGAVSTGVMDPLSATALALESGEGAASAKVILISCDLQHITDGNRPGLNMRDDVRKLVVRAVPELKPEQIILMATHTHAAPYAARDAGYSRFASARIAEAAVKAWKNRKPGGVSYGLGHAVIGHNRIAVDRDGVARMTGSRQRGNVSAPGFSHIEGFEDHSVHLLYTWDKEGKLTGVVVNVACPAQVQRGTLVSADFWHEVRGELAARLGPDVFILPQLSAAGDQAITVMVEKKAEARMQRLMFPETTDSRLLRRKQIARRIADAVASVLPLMKGVIEWNPVLAHKYERVDLQRGFPRPDPSQPVYPVEIHAVRIADVAMVSNPFELYLDYGIRIKGRSPAIQTFLIQLAGSGAYLPTRRAVAGGGYGAIAETCVVGPDAGDQLVDVSLRLLDNLWR